MTNINHEKGSMSVLQKYKIKLILTALLIVLLVLARHVGVGDYINLDYVRNNRELLQNFIANNYFLGVLSFIGVYILVVISLLPLTIILNIMGGYFFGMFPGLLYCMVAATTGVLLTFFTFRYLLADCVAHKYGAALAKFNENFKKDGANYLLSLELFPVTPFGIISVLASLSGISVITFLWTSVVGMLPSTLVYCYAGRQLTTISSVDDIFSTPVIIALSLLAALSLVPLCVRLIKRHRARYK